MLKCLLKKQDPFKGSHWQPQWGAKTPKKFPLVHRDQQMDLVEYFYEHQPANTRQNTPSGFTKFSSLHRLLQRQRSQPRSLKESQSEMSLLRGSDHIAACTTGERPDKGDETRTMRAAALGKRGLGACVSSPKWYANSACKRTCFSMESPEMMED